MILQSLILMVAGMGTVFVFLVVLIYAVEVTSGIVRRIEAK
ncbi:MAG TPA: OadG family protein, partial [Candidatus Avidesulfovibrio excrementigallinarum]|nr:OadG family protein [Candidatus Avidesulfovibrio excrementigallinarum]